MKRALLPSALALALALAACGGGSLAEPTPAVTPPPTATPSPSATTRPPTPTPTLAPPPNTPRPTATPAPGAARAIYRGPDDRDVVALTFDAGADTGYASTILDILRNEGIQASFGMTGQWAERNPALLRRMVDEGHELLNHSYDHASFTGLSTRSAPLTREQRSSELDRTEQIVHDLTGASTKPLFRPPYGDYDNSVLNDVGASGYPYAIMWTADSQGWQGIPASQIIDICLAAAEPGAIYIFHVGSASQDAAALPRVIAGLREQGYEFVTVSGLIGG